MPTLHRAVASIRGSQTDEEVHVFFETASSAEGAPARLLQLLCTAWCVQPDDVEVYNVWSEHELLQELSIGGPRAGDTRLLESGFAGGLPLYCDPRRVILMTRPSTTQRLQAATELVRLRTVASACELKEAA